MSAPGSDSDAGAAPAGQPSTAMVSAEGPHNPCVTSHFEKTTGIPQTSHPRALNPYLGEIALHCQVSRSEEDSGGLEQCYKLCVSGFVVLSKKWRTPAFLFTAL